MILCKICDGPIQAGEYAVLYGDGHAHGFSTWCSWYRAHPWTPEPPAPAAPTQAEEDPPTPGRGP